MNRLVCALALALLLPTASAQAVFDLARLDGLFDRPAKVEVNLRGSLLGLAAAATNDSEPELSDLIRSLDAVTVRVYPLGAARADLEASVGSMMDALAADGWYTMVRVRADAPGTVYDEGEEPERGDVWVYVRDRGDAFGGLAVVALDPDEGAAAFVHIDGLIDPSQVGRLTSRFGNVDVDAEEEGDDDV